MTRKRYLATVAMVATFLLSVGSAAAVSAAGASTVGSVTDEGQFSGTASGTVGVDGGNITQANVSGQQSTLYWAGLYGNASGTLVLGDGTNRLYEWTAKGAVVYADDQSSVTWGSFSSATCSQMNGTYTFLQDAVSDSCSDTFSSTGTFDSALSSGTVSTIKATTQSSGSTTWNTYYITDGSGSQQLFATPVVQNGKAYNGQIADYQTILPEDASGGNDGTTTSYNLWIELK